MKITAIVLAAGSGSRMGTSVKKQYLDLNGHPVLWHSLNAFENSIVDEIVLVCSPEDVGKVQEEYSGEFKKLTNVVEGGAERYDSVYAGLCAITDTDLVFIHDGARPFVSSEMILRCAETLKEEDACVCAVPSKDTVKIADEYGYADSTPDRRLVWIIQTPQCFRYDLCLKAYSKLMEARSRGETGDLFITDDAMVVENFTDTKVKLIMGSYDNIKLTTPEDMPVAERIIKNVHI